LGNGALASSQVLFISVKVMKIFNLYKVKNLHEVVVYNSIGDFTKMVEWQDVFDSQCIIIDELGGIYKWDDTKKDEYATTYDYTLVVKEINLELAKLCKHNYVQKNFSDEFSFET
jgi:hypothetical protein